MGMDLPLTHTDRYGWLVVGDLQRTTGGEMHRGHHALFGVF